jgi:ComF family protein
MGSGPLSTAYSLYPFEGRAAQAVRRLKYASEKALAAPMSAALRLAYDENDLEQFDVIVPVPIHATRRSQRGFNQAELIAEALPSGKTKTAVLKRIKRTKPQVDLTVHERLKNLSGAFRAEPSIMGQSVLLVDDVITTGGTAIACADALVEAGAAQVSILTYCGERSPEDS